MGPKVESSMHFLQAGGREAIITSYDHLCDAVAGRAGTHIVPDTEVILGKVHVHFEVPVGGR